MVTQTTANLPLAKALLLIGLLLVGRAFLSTHHYDHDLANLETDCEYCEFFHVFKDDTVPGAEAVSAIESKAPNRHDDSRNNSFILLTAYRSRAPPTIHV